jgi:hypothetical protein
VRFHQNYQGQQQPILPIAAAARTSLRLHRSNLLNQGIKLRPFLFGCPIPISQKAHKDRNKTHLFYDMEAIAPCPISTIGVWVVKREKGKISLFFLIPRAI